jgi:hypothetical protein
MEEEVKAVLTERKTKSGIDQGKLAVRDGRRLLPVKSGNDSLVSREPNKGKKMARGRFLPCSGARQRAESDGGSSGRRNPSSTDELGF